MAKWLNGSCLKNDVVISSRIRLARNLEDVRFPQDMTMEESKEVTDEILDVVKGWESDKYEFHKIGDLSSLERRVLIEEHLISPSLIESPDKSSFLLRNDEKVTIMINEEDHLRVQILSYGLNLENDWNELNQIDDMLEAKLNYAFSGKFGYLTACPTNVGTGIRASVMIHLPCLVLTGYINNMLQAVNQIGLTTRGLYGEGTEALGNVFQISNQVTLGETEEEIIQKLNNVILQIAEKEKDIRNKLLEVRRHEMEDRVFRSLGLLKYARAMSSRESMKLFSDVKMGIEMGILKDMNSNTIDSLMILTQPASLQKYFNKDLIPEERDIKRAELIRERL